MIILQNTYLMDKPIQEVWALFNDISGLAQCFPTTKHYEVVDENTVNLVLRLVLGAIPLENRVTMSITKREPPSHIAAEGVSYSGTAFKKMASVDKDSASQITVDLYLTSLSDTETKIAHDMRVEAIGSIKRIYEAILKTKRKKMEEEFLDNIRKTAKAEVTEVAED